MSEAERDAIVKVYDNVEHLPGAGAIACAWQVVKRPTQVAAQSRGPACPIEPLPNTPIRLSHCHIAA